MASAVYSYQSSSPVRWFGESKTEEDAPSEIVRSEELATERDASTAMEESIPHAFEGIIGVSEALQRVLAHVKTVASTDSTVLLEGETGTGKELISQAIHALSRRRARNFVKLNCAAIPSGLLESELFGNEKGAFTGALSKKIGRIELADKGTLFLDEIGEIPLALQPKLLRVLEDQEFERLGESIHSRWTSV